MNKDDARTVPSRRTLILTAALCLAYGLCLLLWSLGFAAGGGEPRPARSAPSERTLAGGDEGGLPTELLPGQKLDLNQASAEELQLLPGIGEKLSQAIVEYREQNGPFESVDALTRVPGIGEKKLEAVRDLVYVGPEVPDASG